MIKLSEINYNSSTKRQKQKHEKTDSKFIVKKDKNSNKKHALELMALLTWTQNGFLDTRTHARTIKRWMCRTNNK